MANNDDALTASLGKPHRMTRIVDDTHSAAIYTEACHRRIIPAWFTLRNAVDDRVASFNRLIYISGGAVQRQG